MATRVGWGKIQLAAIDGPFPKTSAQMQKSIADISYTSPVIKNFVVNFVAVATGVCWEEMRLAAFDGSSPKFPYRRKNLAEISYMTRVIANFVPNFVTLATGVNRR